MADVPPRDNRGLFMIPQDYEGGGYYCYGTPNHGRFSYAHPALITLVTRVAMEWCGRDGRKFGVGNISLAEGVARGHRTHRGGLDVDIRPLRKDGQLIACTIQDREYDAEATKMLIEIFLRTGMVKSILFNDTRILGVKRWAGHDNHFHLTALPR